MAWGDDIWGVAVWGELVGVPGPAVEKSPGELTQEEAFGIDIKFCGDYTVGPTGDYSVLESVSAVKQAILHRLVTRPGELALRPDYGVGVQSFVKDRRTRSTTDRLKNRIIDQLSLEPRIETTDVTVKNTIGGLSVTVAVTVAGRSLKFQPFVFNETGLL